MVDFRILKMENINSPIEKLDCKILCKLIMEIKTLLRERVFFVIEKL